MAWALFLILPRLGWSTPIEPTEAYRNLHQATSYFEQSLGKQCYQANSLAKKFLDQVDRSQLSPALLKSANQLTSWISGGRMPKMRDIEQFRLNLHLQAEKEHLGHSEMWHLEVARECDPQPH